MIDLINYINNAEFNQNNDAQAKLIEYLVL